MREYYSIQCRVKERNENLVKAQKFFYILSQIYSVGRRVYTYPNEMMLVKIFRCVLYN